MQEIDPGEQVDMLEAEPVIFAELLDKLQVSAARHFVALYIFVV